MNKNFMYVKGKALFSMLLIAFLLVSTNKVDVAAASPETTYFYVDPPEVNGAGQPIGYQFAIDIYVNDAPDTYAWEVHVSWDPNIVEVFFKQEGDFLKRPPTNYPTTFAVYPTTFEEANLQGEITVAASLIGDVLWANGTGKLSRLGFEVVGVGSSVINLFDTLLVDHFVAGAAQGKTYYPNNDSFFFNEPFHDVAITSVTRAQAAELVAINVTVTNEGNITETSETFNVTVYADTTVYEYTYDATDKLIKTTTVVGDEIVVGTQILANPLVPGDTTTLTFNWNTTGAAGGIYTISAEVKGDDDTRDNLFIDGTVTVQVHDIGITNITVSPTVVTVGDNVTVKVTVRNEGHFNETFNVTTYYDINVIETKTNINLTAGANKTLTFIWDTTDVAKGTYTIKAEASVVPDEIDTEDNMLTFDGTVKVRGAAAPDILPYVAVVIVIIIGAAIAVYFLWFRKPT